MAEIENIDYQEYRQPVLPKVFSSKSSRAVMLFLVISILAATAYGLYILSRKPDPTEILILAESVFAYGKPANAMVLVRNASSNAPISGQTVKLSLVQPKKQPVPLPSVTTGYDGIAIVKIPPEITTSGYPDTALYGWHATLKAETGKFSARHEISISSPKKCHLSTDKPIYQPGQTMKIRAMVMTPVSQRPVPQNEVTISIKDSRNNELLSQSTRTSEFGIVDAELPLSEHAVPGIYKISANAQHQNFVSTEVEVKEYRLPNFKLHISTDKDFYTPGSIVRGTINSDYLWGMPLPDAKIVMNVSATVIKRVKKDPQSIWGCGHGHACDCDYKYVPRQKNFNQTELNTGKNGIISFSFKLPEKLEGLDLKSQDSEFTISAEATAPDGLKQKVEVARKLTMRPLQITALPEFSVLLPDRSNSFLILTSLPDGTGTQTALTVNGQKLETKKSGIARYMLPPVKNKLIITARNSANCQPTTKTVEVKYNDKPEVFYIKTDKSIYQDESIVNIQLISNKAGGNIFISIIKNGISVGLFPVKMSSKDQHCKYKIPDDLAGTIQLHAYRVMPSGSVMRDLRIIQVNRAGLDLKAVFNKPQYKPGETVKVDFSVKNDRRQPVRAAIGVTAVDEAVFALKPGRTLSARACFLLQEEIFKEEYRSQATKLLRINNSVNSDFLTCNINSVNHLHKTCCIQYRERQKQLDKNKEKHGNGLFDTLSIILFVLSLATIVPMAKMQQGAIITDALTCTKISAVINNSLTLIIASIYACIVTMLACHVYSHKLLDSYYRISFFMVILVTALIVVITSWNLHSTRNKIRTYLLESSVINRYILNYLNNPTLFFIMFAVTTIIYCIGLIYFPTARIQKIFLLNYLMMLAISMLFMSEILHFITTREQYDVQLNSKNNLAPGLKGINRAETTVWILGATFYNGPFILVYLFVSITAISMFLPFFKVIECLGGGGNYHWSARTSRPAKFFSVTATKDVEITGLKKRFAPRVRRFFPETLYWNPQLITGRLGRAGISFNAADSITNYRFTANAISATGKLAELQREIKVFQNFFVDFNPPSKVINGDIVSVPLTLFNYLKEPQVISFKTSSNAAFKILTLFPPVQLPPESVKTIYLKLKFIKSGTCKVTITAIGSKSSDAIEREVEVFPDGKKVETVIDGIVEKAGTKKFKFPDNALPDGHQAYIRLFPTPLPKIALILKAMLQRPYGCCEQTTSSLYTNMLIWQYLWKTKAVMPDLESSVLRNISTGRQSVLSFQQPSGGYSWYRNNAKPSLRLTAYTLTTCHGGSREAESRAIDYLATLQQPDGSWKMSAKPSVDLLTATAYIAGALSKSSAVKSQLIDNAFNYIEANHPKNNDPYTLVLCADALAASKPNAAKRIIERLIDMKHQSGRFVYWHSKLPSSPLYSSGKYLDIETTALIIIELMKTGMYPKLVRGALLWMYDNDSFMYGQARIQFLRAMIMNAENTVKKRFAPFKFTAKINNTSKSVDINSNNSNLLHYLSFKHALKHGENIIASCGSDKVLMGYQVVVSYYVPWLREKVKKDALIDLTASYIPSQGKVGDKVLCKLFVRSVKRDSLSMGIIIIPIPPGLSPIKTSLDKLIKKSAIDNFEIQNGNVILYLKKFTRNGTILGVEFNPIYPCRVTTPPVSAYPYYEPEQEVFDKPEDLTVI